MQDIETKSALGLMSILSLRGIGPVTALKVANAFSTFGEMVAASPEAFKGIATEPNRKTLTEDRAALSAAISAAEREIANADQIGARVLSLYDEDYPARLASVHDRPLCLYVSGDMSGLDRSVACVGSREVTEFGAAVAERMTCALAEEGWSIVSGLARGIDSIAHEAALKVGAPTIAIIGSGIDTYSSKPAFELLSRIVEAGGTVITEQPLGREADPASLVRRNRLQTGISAATFVMQCALESGTMHAVRYALHQGRPIFAPAIPDRFAGDHLHEGVITILRLSGRDLAEVLTPSPSKDLRRILEEEFADKPVANAVQGKDAYPALFARLNSLAPRKESPLELAVPF